MAQKQEEDRGRSNKKKEHPEEEQQEEGAITISTPPSSSSGAPTLQIHRRSTQSAPRASRSPAPVSPHPPIHRAAIVAYASGVQVVLPLLCRYEQQF